MQFFDCNTYLVTDEEVRDLVYSLTSYSVLVGIQPFIKLLFVGFFGRFRTKHEASAHPHIGISNKPGLTPTSTRLGLPQGLRSHITWALRRLGLPHNLCTINGQFAHNTRTIRAQFVHNSHTICAQGWGFSSS